MHATNLQDIKPERGASSREDRIRNENDLGKLEKWSKMKSITFKKDRCKVLHFDKNNQLHIYKKWLVNNSAEKYLERAGREYNESQTEHEATISHRF